MRLDVVYILPFGGQWCLWSFGAKAPYASFQSRARAIRTADESTYTRRTRVVLHDEQGEVERAWFVGGRPVFEISPSGEYRVPRGCDGRPTATRLSRA